MSKPRDPVIAVITYFESAELALAQQTLAIVQAIVKRRQPRATPTIVKRRSKHPIGEPAAV